MTQKGLQIWNFIFFQFYGRLKFQILSKIVKIAKFKGSLMLSLILWHIRELQSNVILNIIHKEYTVEPLYSGHYRFSEKVSAIERCPL